MQTRLLYFLFALLFFSCNSSSLLDKKDDFAQAEQWLETQPDSALALANGWLKDTAVKKINDPSLIQIYLLKERAFSKKFQVDSVLRYAHMIRELAASTNDSLAIAESLLHIVGDMDESEKAKIEKLLPASIRQMEIAGRRLDVAKLEGKYGIILTTRGEYSQSQPHLIKAYSILKDSSRKRELISVCLGIGGNFSGIGSNKEMFKYYYEAYQLASELKDADRLTLTMINLGYYYSHIKNRDSARYYYDLAKATAPPHSQYIVRTKIDYNINNDLMRTGEYLEAKKGFRGVLDSIEGKGMLEAEAMVQRALSQSYLALGQTAEAIQALNRSLELADSLKDDGIKLESSENLRDIYAKKGDYSLAYQQQLLYQQLKDSMLSKDKQVAIHDLEEKYQSEKKEVENAKLRADLKFRKLMLVSLVFLVILLVIVLYIFRQRNLFLNARNLSYEVLMNKYKEQMIERSEVGEDPADLVPPVVPVLKNHRDVFFNSMANENENRTIVDITKEELDLLGALEKLIRKEKLFLNPKLKIEPIAAKLGVNERSISGLVNRCYRLNISQYINRFRVEEAQRLLEKSDALHLKLDAIGNSAGFGSRQNFYAVFEQVTGVNPGYYRSSIHESKK